MTKNFLDRLRQDQTQRASVFWQCGGDVAVTTGKVLQVGADFIEVEGVVPTSDEAASAGAILRSRADGVLLSTVIPLQSLHAVVDGIPEGRRAMLPGTPVKIRPSAGGPMEPDAPDEFLHSAEVEGEEDLTPELRRRAPRTRRRLAQLTPRRGKKPAVRRKQPAVRRVVKVVRAPKPLGTLRASGPLKVKRPARLPKRPQVSKPLPQPPAQKAPVQQVRQVRQVPQVKRVQVQSQSHTARKAERVKARPPVVRARIRVNTPKVQHSAPQGQGTHVSQVLAIPGWTVVHKGPARSEGGGLNWLV